MELKPGYKQTEVGVIPEDWDVVLLDSVARRGSGHTPDKAHPEYWGGDIKWVSLADSQRLDNLYISETSATITAEGIANSSANLLPAGSCIVTRDAGVGKSAILAEPMAVSQHFMAWHCGPRLSNHYLYFLLQAMKPELERIAIGNTIKTIGLPYFKSLRIQLPSLAEQNSIALALTEVDQLIRELERSVTKKQSVKQATMQELLTGKRRLPGFEGEWEVKRLGDIATIDPENLGSNTHPHYRFNYISLEDVDQGSLLNWSEQEFSTSPSRARRRLRRNDVLVSTVRPNLMSHLLFSQDGGEWVCSTGFALLRCNCELADPSYVFFHLFSAFINKQIEGLLTGSNYPAISSRDVRSLEIPAPALSEQKEIARILTSMEDEIISLTQRLEKARLLKQGMMQQLLTGKIRLT